MWGNIVLGRGNNSKTPKKGSVFETEKEEWVTQDEIREKSKGIWHTPLRISNLIQVWGGNTQSFEQESDLV